MKKLLSVITIIVITLLVLVRYVGNLAEQETRKALADEALQNNPDLAIKLLSYDRSFFGAVAKTEITLNAHGQKPIVILSSSVVSHLPYKAVVVTELEIKDKKIAKNVSAYFGRDDWFSSREEVNLFGQVSGELSIVAGEYKSSTETLKTSPLAISYKLNINDMAGEAQLIWEDIDVTIESENTVMKSLALNMTFEKQGAEAQSQDYKYAYELTAKRVHSQMVGVSTPTTAYLIEGISIKGSSEMAEQAHRMNSYNDLSVANYQLGNDKSLVFKNNHLKFDLLGTYEPIISDLSSSSGRTAESLGQIFNKGLHLSQASFSSETPWGKVGANMDINLEAGADLPHVANNVFMLFDYTSGTAHFSVPKILLKLPLFAGYLQEWVQQGMIIQAEDQLILDLKFEQGELLINGTEYPL